MALLYAALICGIAYYGKYNLHRGTVYEFDWADRPGSFQFVYAPYRGLFWAIFFISLPGAFAMDYIQAYGSAGALLIAALCAFLFNGFITFFYESYLAVRWTINPPGRSNYTAVKHSLVMALGVTAVVMFIVGIVAAFGTIAGW